MPIISGWKLYYIDGSVFSSKDGTWAQAPSAGLLFVVVFFGSYPCWRGKDLISENYRRFFLDDETPDASRIGKVGFWQTLSGQFGYGTITDAPLGASLKTTTWLDDENYYRVYNKMLTDTVWA